MNSIQNDSQFLALIQTNKKLIYKVCNSYCNNAEDKKDLAQEIIIQLWQSYRKYDDQYKLSTWMYRIALNVAISFYRKEHKRNKAPSGGSESLLHIIDNNEESEQLESNIQLLHQFIDQLDELNKALIITYLDGKSYQEIAEILGITETNVATKISRIKQKLKQQFSTIQ